MSFSHQSFAVADRFAGGSLPVAWALLLGFFCGFFGKFFIRVYLILLDGGSVSVWAFLSNDLPTSPPTPLNPLAYSNIRILQYLHIVTCC